MICLECKLKYYEGIQCLKPKCPLMPLRRPCIPDKHFTFPDDPEAEPRPGWGPFKFDWLMRKHEDFVRWHDDVTTICSVAQRIGVTNEQVNEYTKIMLSGRGFVGRNVARFLVTVNRFFYEGKLK